MTRLLFVGECRSLTAQRRGWTWKDGRLAAKPLFEALEAMGVDPSAAEFYNAFHDPPVKRHVRGWNPSPNEDTLTALWSVQKVRTIVALGKRVSAELTRRGIDHVALVHPAARGRIRKRERYHAHVKRTLGPALATRRRKVA